MTRMKRLNKYCLTENGFAIVENMVAIAVIAGIALAGLAMMSYFTRKTTLQSSQCKLYAQQVIDQIRGQAIVPTIYPFRPGVSADPNTNDLASNQIPAGGYSNAFLTSTAARWPGTVSVDPTGGVPSPQPYLQSSFYIDGAMNTLLAIYNSNASFCSTPTIYTPITGTNMLQLTNADGSVITPTIQIIPYNTETGATLTCAANWPLYITPSGEYSDTQTAANGNGSRALGESAIANGIMQRSSTFKTNVGLLLKVSLSYTYSVTGNSVKTTAGANNGDVQNQGCMVQQTFQYPTDKSPPAVPSIQVAVSYAANYSACLNLQNSVQVAITSSNEEGGTLYVCRNAYWDPATAPDMAITSLPPDVAGPAPSAQVSGSILACVAAVGGDSNLPQPVTWGPAQAYTADQPNNVGWTASDLQSSTPTMGQWVPCDQLTICGQSANYPTTGSASGGITLSYSNVTPGCRDAIEVAAVDTAGNARVVPTTDQQNDAGGAWVGGAANTTMLGGFPGSGAYVTTNAFDYFDVPMAPCNPHGGGSGYFLWCPGTSPLAGAQFSPPPTPTAAQFPYGFFYCGATCPTP
jgi:type II secretory pathway pseudopilin PulG